MNTKKFVLPLAAVIVTLAVVLVACGAKSSAINTTGGTTGGTGGVAPNGTPGAAYLTQPLPLAESLLVGTIKLQGTSNAVDAKTAAALVPLWQAYAQLTSSNTAAQAEIDAVLTQIQDTMTPQRVQAITAMKLTRKDLTAAETSLGITNAYGASGTGTPGFRLTPGAGRGGGGGFFPGGGDAGGPPGDAGGGGGFGGGAAGGAGGTGAARATPNATQQALRAQFANRISTPLMNALIALLQKTAGA